MTDLTKSANGYDYKDAKFLAKRHSRQHVLQLAIDNPDWDLQRLMDEQLKEFPTYTEAAIRMALKDAGIVRKKPRPRGPRVPKVEAVKARKVKAAVVRTVVHGYSGRSRLHSSYYEL